MESSGYNSESQRTFPVQVPEHISMDLKEVQRLRDPIQRGKNDCHCKLTTHPNDQGTFVNQILMAPKGTIGNTL